jgi:hypothetical protein
MKKLHSVMLRSAVAVALIGSAGALSAQDLPAAAELVARYQQAIGGKDVFARHTAMHMKGEFAMPAMGISASFESWAARPNRSVMHITIPGLGEMRQGFDGTVGWSLNPMEGPRVLAGGELQQMSDESAFDSQFRPESLVASMETVERTTIAGRDCIKVRVQWKSGRETFDCYSAETGLIVGSMAKQESNMGVAEVVTLYDDYKAFGGVTMPTRMTMQIMGMEQVISIHDVTFGDVPESAFELPAEIKPLIKP